MHTGSYYITFVSVILRCASYSQTDYLFVTPQLSQRALCVYACFRNNTKRHQRESLFIKQTHWTFVCCTRSTEAHSHRKLISIKRHKFSITPIRPLVSSVTLK